jgi:hypothetical protein
VPRRSHTPGRFHEIHVETAKPYCPFWTFCRIDCIVLDRRRYDRSLRVVSQRPKASVLPRLAFRLCWGIFIQHRSRIASLATPTGSATGHPENSGHVLKYAITDYWSGDVHQIEDWICGRSPTSADGGGGSSARARAIVCGCSIFHSAVGGPIVSPTLRSARPPMTAHSGARRLGGNWIDEQYPDKPPRMRWRDHGQNRRR